LDVLHAPHERAEIWRISPETIELPGILRPREKMLDGAREAARKTKKTCTRCAVRERKARRLQAGRAQKYLVLYLIPIGPSAVRHSRPWNFPRRAQIMAGMTRDRGKWDGHRWLRGINVTRCILTGIRGPRADISRRPSAAEASNRDQGFIAICIEAMDSRISGSHQRDEKARVGGVELHYRTGSVLAMCLCSYSIPEGTLVTCGLQAEGSGGACGVPE